MELLTAQTDHWESTMATITAILVYVCDGRGGACYQVSIKVESPREVSAAEMVNRPAVHDKVMHPYSLKRQTRWTDSKTTEESQQGGAP